MATETLQPNSGTVPDRTNAIGGSMPTILSDSNDGTYLQTIVGPAPDFVAIQVESTGVTSPNLIKRYRAAIRLSRTPSVSYTVNVADTQILGQEEWLGPTLVLTSATPTTIYSAWVDANVETWNNNLTAAVRDPGNVLSNDTRIYKAWIEVEYFAPPTAPTTVNLGAITTTRKPKISWTHNGDDVQHSFRVKIFDADTYPTPDPDATPTVLDSGWVTSSAQSWTPTTHLPNGKNYKYHVATRHYLSKSYQVSPWSTVRTFNIQLALTAPTNVIPAANATITSSKPPIGANIATQPSSIGVKRQWQVASDSGFTIDLQSYTDATASTSKSGTITFPSSWTRLPQASWYIRARTVDSDGQTSAWTTANLFNVVHVPTTGNRQPSGARSVAWNSGDVEFSWSFSDPDLDDFQTAYEIEYWLDSTPGVVSTTGKVVSSDDTVQVTLPVDHFEELSHWRIRVWDQDDVASAWSTSQSFIPYDLPLPVITSPVGIGATATAEPTIEWTFSASGGRTQKTFRVVVTDLDSGLVVADSGTVTSAATSWQVPSPVILIGPTYQIDLTVVDSDDLANTDTGTFTATYTLPDSPTFVVSEADFRDFGYAYIDWSSALIDANNIAWRVYRRVLGDVEWTLLAELEPTVRFLRDYSAASNIDVEYSVVQVIETLGAEVESAYPIVKVNLYDDKYMLIVPDDPTLNLTLFHVTGDSFADEQEQAEINLIGRGRQVQLGTKYGVRGTLNGTFRDNIQMTGRAQRLYLEAIRDSNFSAYMRNPFGDVWKVTLMSASISRVAGVGLQEISTYTIEYVEVTT